MRTEDIYVADDSENILTEEKHLDHETVQKPPIGVYLYDLDFKPVTTAADFEYVYRMYIATEDGLKWVRDTCKKFGISDEGIKTSKHLACDENDIWFSLEDEIADCAERIRELCGEIDQYGV